MWNGNIIDEYALLNKIKYQIYLASICCTGVSGVGIIMDDAVWDHPVIQSKNESNNEIVN